MTLVVSLGSDDRGDDGAGPAVADRVRAMALPGVRVRGCVDPSRLLEAWAGEPDVVVVDAVRADHEPAGTVFVLEAGTAQSTLPGWTRRSPAAGGTHTLSLADAVRLGRALDVLPPRLVVVGVVGECFTVGAGLSDPVRAALDRAAAVVASRVGSRAARGTREGTQGQQLQGLRD
jgi:hydrogenase maturation protease